MYKIIFIDVDGTLLTTERKVDNKIIEACKKAKEQGVECVLNSGRNRQYALNLSEYIGAGDYVISSTGGDVFNVRLNKSIKTAIISTESVKHMYDIATNYDCKLRIISDGIPYVNRDLFHEDDNGEIVIEENIDSFLKNHIVSQCVFMGDDYKKLYKAICEVKTIFDVKIGNYSKAIFESDEYMIVPGYLFFDVIQKDVNKAYGIKTLCSHLNIDTSNTAAIGDDFNDIDMFNNVGYKIAMGNARNELKILADFITDTNNEGGVAKAIYKVLELNKNEQ